MITANHVQVTCKQTNPKWLKEIKLGGGRKPKANVLVNNTSKQTAELTQADQEYIQAHKEEYRRNQILNELFELWTGKNETEQGRIIQETPKGSSWRKRLIEESREPFTLPILLLS